MEIFKSIIDLLKAYAWPIFLFIVILKFYGHILNFFKFFAELIRDRGFSGRYGNYELQIRPGDPDTAKQKLSNKVREDTFISSLASTSPSSLSPHSTSTTSTSSTTTTTTTQPPNSLDKNYNIIEYQNSIRMGFGIVNKNGFEIIDQLSTRCDPEIKIVAGIEYNIGQKVNFAVQNLFGTELFSPFLQIQFPSKFKHLSTENPEKGIMTINSELWGIGGISTELIDLNAELSELSCFLGRRLKPGQIARFFIRFKLPDEKESFNVIMKLKPENYGQIEIKLLLNAN
jgi:hypothetical protein